MAVTIVETIVKVYRVKAGTFAAPTIKPLGGEIGNTGRKEQGGHRPNPRLRQTSRYLTKANQWAHVPIAKIRFEPPKRKET